ncbi:hypothetical protein [Comamonas sp. CMM02]|uniref:hypothetical protein n=1 Tax=Comamonas sp. CMM02 TaxID=2769307 RepID=UPI00178522DD|nr:hypothetical protein [Comamonas sp. CMM02]MBD9402128.1 hypothetical protein [Comamonas sp. CMM02]
MEYKTHKDMLTQARINKLKSEGSQILLSIMIDKSPEHMRLCLIDAKLNRLSAGFSFRAR